MIICDKDSRLCKKLSKQLKTMDLKQLEYQLEFCESCSYINKAKTYSKVRFNYVSAFWNFRRNF